MVFRTFRDAGQKPRKRILLQEYDQEKLSFLYCSQRICWKTLCKKKKKKTYRSFALGGKKILNLCWRTLCIGFQVIARYFSLLLTSQTTQPSLFPCLSSLWTVMTRMVTVLGSSFLLLQKFSPYLIRKRRVELKKSTSLVASNECSNWLRTWPHTESGGCSWEVPNENKRQ